MALSHLSHRLLSPTTSAAMRHQSEHQEIETSRCSIAASAAMHHIGACHGQGEGREDSEGRDGEALQGAQEEEHGGEEATDGGDMARGEETWEECGDGVELTRGERLRRRLGGWSRHTDPVDGVNEGSAPGASERRREAGQWVWRGGGGSTYWTSDAPCPTPSSTPAPRHPSRTSSTRSSTSSTVGCGRATTSGSVFVTRGP
jgi:hypothetical protein